jgi:hypothetical protein
VGSVVSIQNLCDSGWENYSKKIPKMVMNVKFHGSYPLNIA